MLPACAGTTNHKSAFSLVELSIVLVILGLLVGGILSGQSLIKAAELRSLTSDITRYQTATQTFRDKYFALPGDMTNATAFWGTAAICAGAGASSPGTCNGDGDGQIETGAGGALTGENFQMWNHLAKAGLIEGTYTGVAGPEGVNYSDIGINVPRTKISNVGVYLEYVGVRTASAWWWDGEYGNLFYIGTDIGTQLGAMDFKPEDMWNMDTKLDDGKPATGIMTPYRKASRPDCTTTNVASTSEYNLTYTSGACNILVKAN